MTQPLFVKGHIFKNTLTGQIYVLEEDVYRDMVVEARHFTAFYGAEEPKTGDTIPEWLVKQIGL